MKWCKPFLIENSGNIYIFATSSACLSDSSLSEINGDYSVQMQLKIPIVHELDKAIN